MLPGRKCRSGSMGEFLVGWRFGWVCEGAANLAEYRCWGDGLSPSVGVLQQEREYFARVGVGDCPPERPPQPLDTVGLRVVRRRVDQHELSAQLIEELPQQERALRRVDAQVVHEHQGDPPARLRALDGSAQLGA